MRTWVNGELLEPEAAVLPVLDHGFTVGDGVFETVKVVDGVPFALTRHLRRLAASASGLGIPAPDLDVVAKACAEVLTDAGPGDFRLRVTYTGGTAPLGSDRGDAMPSLVVALAPLTAWEATAKVAAVPWVRNERGALSGLKTTSYAENVVALAAAKAQGATEALLANTQGRLCEGTGSNVFVVLGERVLTPSTASGCLAGVTRALVLEWSDAEEADLPLEVLEEADEVFLTSTTRDVQGVHAVGDRTWPGAPGPVTTRLAVEFARRAAADVDP